MKKLFYFLLAIICTINTNITSAQIIKKKVAIYVTGDADNGYKKVIGSKIVSTITNSEEFAAVERTADFLVALSQEQDYQTSGAVNDSQIVRLGQQFGVRYVVVVDVSEVFESLFISARMIDVQTAQIEAASETNDTINSMEKLLNLSENLAYELLGIAHHKAIKFIQGKPLWDFLKNIPNGYHIATTDEFAKLPTKKYPTLTDISLRQTTYNGGPDLYVFGILHKNKDAQENGQFMNIFDTNPNPAVNVWIYIVRD